MEETTLYTVRITPEAESCYYEVLKNFYEHCSEESANKKSEELLEKAIKLEINPLIGTIEEKIRPLGRNHRFVLYYYTSRKAIKIIYYIEEFDKIVYVTDFFPCESNDKKIRSRSL